MRVKGGIATKRRHKKYLKLARGYRDKRSNVYSFAKRAVFIAGKEAYRGRRLKKRDFRRLWISRINAALKPYEMNYSRFIYALTRSRVELDRKVLSELAICEPKVFEEVVKMTKNFYRSRKTG